MIKYCLPIIANDSATVKSLLANNLDNYGYFEVWLDYLTDQRSELVEELSRIYGARMIFLFRRQQLESIKMALSERQELIKVLAHSNSFLDLDISTQQDEYAYLKNNDVSELNLISSFHNYGCTPDDKKLNDIVRLMGDYHPTVYKLACFCERREDAVRLLRLTLGLEEQGKKYIVLGMGEHGAITRVFGTLWGNEMIFAPLSDKYSSAPGQLNRDELEQIFGLLEKQDGG